jgi:hypothetical protein
MKHQNASTKSSMNAKSSFSTRNPVEIKHDFEFQYSYLRHTP